MLNEQYYGCALVTCFDNDGVTPAGEADGDQTDQIESENGPSPTHGPTDEGGNTGNGGADRAFTQDQLNKFLAEDRRKHQQKYESLEGSYQELLASQSLSQEDRTKLEGELEDLRKQHRTKEQQATHERKQLEEQFTTDLGEAQQEATHWKTKYTESTIARALQDAAVSYEAFQPSQIVALLRPMTKLAEKKDEKGQSLGITAPAIDFPDQDAETGEPIVTQRTPDEAVKRMKELPELYGNLFKSNVVSGVGGNSATGGLQPGSNGKIDVRRLTPSQYREIRAKNPELLGLAPKSHR